MKLRSAFLSPPAVAGFALLALVVGTIFGVRSGMSNGGDTEVAGTVIERSEPAEVETDEVQTPAPIVPDLVIDPEPTQPAEPADPPVLVQPDTDPVEVVEAPQQPTGGLIPDPDGPTAPQGDDDEQPTQPRPRNPRPQPEPEPTRSPRPQPEPEPTEEPTPDPQRFALHEGEGFSRDTALANEQGNSGNFNWDIVSVLGHGQSEDAQASREPANRVVAGFYDAAFSSDEPVRDFRCDATVTAGSRRLTTDRNHFFEITMWPADGYELGDEPIHTSFVRVALDLAPGEETVLEGDIVTDLDAADGVDYTCRVEYRS